jgi:hypothetical protein
MTISGVSVGALLFLALVVYVPPSAGNPAAAVTN